MTELGGYFYISDKNGREKQESISKGTSEGSPPPLQHEACSTAVFGIEKPLC